MNEKATETGTEPTGTEPTGTEPTGTEQLTSKQRTILEAILFLIGKGELPTVREVGSLVGLRSPATVLKHLRVLEKASLISLSGKSRGIRISDPELLERVLKEGAAGTGSDSSRDSKSRFSPPPSGSASAEGTRESVPGGPVGEILQTHFPGVTRLRSHGFYAVPQRERPSSRHSIPLAGAIAAGHPFESYSEAYMPEEFASGGVDDFGYAEYAPGAASSNEISAGPMLEIDPKVFCDNGDVLALKVEGNSMVNVGILDGDYAIIRRQNTVEEGEIAAVIINGEGTLKRWSTRAGDGRNRKTAVSLLPENEDFDPIEITEEEGKDVLVIGKYVGLIRGIQPIL